MTEAQPIGDRVLRLEILQAESDKRMTRFEAESRAAWTEIKADSRAGFDKLGAELRDIKVEHAKDAEKMSVEIAGLREVRARVQGGGHLLGWIATAMGGSGWAAFMLDRVFGRP